MTDDDIKVECFVIETLQSISKNDLEFWFLFQIFLTGYKIGAKRVKQQTKSE